MLMLKILNFILSKIKKRKIEEKKKIKKYNEEKKESKRLFMILKYK